jgi:hypothetical protein
VPGVAGARRQRQGVDLGQQLVEAALAGGHGGDDGQAHLGRQLLDVDAQALALWRCRTC